MLEVLLILVVVGRVLNSIRKAIAEEEKKESIQLSGSNLTSPIENEKEEKDKGFWVGLSKALTELMEELDVEEADLNIEPVDQNKDMVVLSTDSSKDDPVRTEDLSQKEKSAFYTMADARRSYNDDKHKRYRQSLYGNQTLFDYKIKNKEEQVQLDPFASSRKTELNLREGIIYKEILDKPKALRKS